MASSAAGCWEAGRPLPAVVSQHVTGWANDPWACGAYSYLPVGAEPADRIELAKPISSSAAATALASSSTNGNAVFFCGEACHTLYPSTMHGAYLSGVETAAAVCKQLGVSVPPQGDGPMPTAEATASGGEAAAAARVAATAATWAAPLRSPTHKLGWAQLTQQERSAAIRLGYTYTNWDHGGAADGSGLNPVEEKAWSQLSASQRKDAKVLGYTAAAWDASESEEDSSSEDE